jgi:putative nucleotidyltransferase with HDIG domain
METLARVEARDACTTGHSRRVHGFAVAIGRELGLAADALGSLGYAALLHDVGKAAIPDEILLKPSGLTDDEWTLMRRHPDEGARMASEAGIVESAVPAIRHHHEHYDGRGYPEGLAGDEIPLAARIIHVADALDSMLTTRVYRPGRPAREALTELRRETGRQFCPSCVAALERLVIRGDLVESGLTARALVTLVPAASLD